MQAKITQGALAASAEAADTAVFNSLIRESFRGFFRPSSSDSPIWMAQYFSSTLTYQSGPGPRMILPLSNSKRGASSRPMPGTLKPPGTSKPSGAPSAPRAPNPPRAPGPPRAPSPPGAPVPPDEPSVLGASNPSGAPS